MDENHFNQDKTLTDETDYREKCLRAKGRNCVVCGGSDDIVVHHIDGNRDNNEISNLVPVCKEHHRQIHSKDADLGKWSAVLGDDEMVGRKPRHTDQEILRMFHGGPPVRFTDEMADNLNMSQQGAYKRLTKLQERGLVEKHTTGQAAVWWLTELGYTKS
jgi:predicted transcriptional regulator